MKTVQCLDSGEIFTISDEYLTEEGLVLSVKYEEEQEPPVIAKPKSGKFVLQHHWWKKREIIRVGPSAEHWDIRFDVDYDYLLQLVCDDNIIEVDATDCTYKRCEDKAWMKKEGYIPPSQPGNPTKDTPAWIKIIDSGDVTVYQWSETFAKIEFRGKKLKGLYTLTRESPEINLWTLEKSELPSPR